jgi:hypothetical protein
MFSTSGRWPSETRAPRAHPSSFGATSRLNHALSRWPGCVRAQLRLRRCTSLIASLRA